MALAELEQYRAPEGFRTIWAPHRGTQVAALTCDCRELLFGGAAGGGKSEFLLNDYAAGVEEWGSDWRGILIRQRGPEFDELERRALEIFGPIYGESAYRSSKGLWLFPTPKGTASLKLVPIVDGKAVLKIQGRSWNWAGVDEIAQFPNDDVLEYLWTRMRSAGGAPIYVRMTANPGGIGHNWVCERFQINDKPHMQPQMYDEGEEGEEPFYRVFIPSLVTDNHTLMDNDPTYVRQMDQIADTNMRRALRAGDWTVSMGAAFPEFDRSVHVVPHVEPPPGARCWRAMDWGNAKPCSTHWAYVDSDGCVNIFHELYIKGAKADTGRKMPAAQVAQRVRDIEDDYGIHVKTAYLDPACWQEHEGLDSIFKRLGGHKMRWRKWPTGGNWRFNKKQMLHEYLKVVNGESRIKIHDNCPDLVRTLSFIPTDPGNPEDVDTRAEDHAFDSVCGLLHRTVKKPRRARYDPLHDLFFDDVHPGEVVEGKYGSW